MLETIKSRLAPLEPTYLEIIDESPLHQGHIGAKEGVITHVKIIISSEQFHEKSRITCHRMVQNLLSDLFKGNLHALSIVVKF